MKKVILVSVFVIIMGLVWFDIFAMDVQIIAKQVIDVGVNSQKAVISAVVAAMTGIIIFLWRRKDDIKKKYRN